MWKATRPLFLIIVLVLTSCISGWAANAGNDPVQAGYAIATPSSSPSGLVVFETFGQKDGNATTQAGVLPANMTTDALLFVRSDNSLTRNLGVAITDPGSTNANLTLTLRRADGSIVTTKTLLVLAKQQTSQFVTELFSGTPEVDNNFNGTLTITSDTPVAIVGLRFRGVNFSTLPVTNLSPAMPVPLISTGIGGAGAVILPQFAAGGGWETEIVIVNAGSSTLTVRVDLFKSDGTPLTATLNGRSASSFMGLVIPAGGVLVLSPGNGNGGDDF